MKFKIVYFIGSINLFGGTERVLISKANYLSNTLNHQVYIICYSAPNEDVKKLLCNKITLIIISDLLPIYFLHIKFISFLIKIWDIRKLYISILTKIKPDFLIVLEKGFDDFIVPRLKLNAITIRESHSSKKANDIRFKFNFKNLKTYFMHQLYISSFKKYDAVVLLTEYDKIHRGSKSNYYVIPNLVDMSPGLSPSLNSHKAISVGRLDKYKNHKDLIIIWSKIVQNFPDWTLDIYGEGTEYMNLSKLIVSLKLQKNVFLKGNNNNMNSIYPKYSMFLFTSISEGFGMVIVEAMQFGLPVICFDCFCGPAEIVNNDVDGFLINLGDLVGFQMKIETLINNETMLKEFSLHAKENAARFRCEAIMNKWQDFFAILYEGRD